MNWLGKYTFSGISRLSPNEIVSRLRNVVVTKESPDFYRCPPVKDFRGVVGETDFLITPNLKTSSLQRGPVEPDMEVKISLRSGGTGIRLGIKYPTFSILLLYLWSAISLLMSVFALGLYLSNFDLILLFFTLIALFFAASGIYVNVIVTNKTSIQLKEVLFAELDVTSQDS